VAQPRKYSFCGEKSVNICVIDSSKQASVMLGVSMAGEFLPHFSYSYSSLQVRTVHKLVKSLMKSKMLPNGNLNGTFYTVQEKAWVNEPKC
jgi:hypothetical protein